MVPPRGEVDEGPARAGEIDARGLRRDHGLEGDRVQQERFHELRFDQWRRHPQERLFSEHGLAFGDSPDVAAEAQGAQGLEEGLIERTQRAEVRDRFAVELEPCEVGERVFEAARHEEAAAGWQLAHR